MMKKDSFKKLGILGVSFALMTSPLAFADMHEDEEEPKTGTTQESNLNDDKDLTNSTEFESDSSDEEASVGNGVDDPKTGTRQQSDLDEDQDSMNSAAGDSEGTIPGTGAESEPDAGTRGQPDEK